MSSPVMLLSTYAYLESKYVLRKGFYLRFFKLILGILQPKNNKKS